MTTMDSKTMERVLRQLLADRLRQEVPALDLDTDLVRELGLDSLARLQLLAAVEVRCGVRIPDRQLAGLHTLRQVISVIEGLKADGGHSNKES